MANFDFDLESAEIELERTNDLLGIFQEFICDECPEPDECGNETTLAALMFATRAQHFGSLIDAAQDKIAALRETMKTAIDAYFASAKENGGDVA